MRPRYACLLAVLVALSATVGSERPNDTDRRFSLRYGSAGCTSLQNDRFHYYRPPRRLPSDPVERDDTDRTIDLGALEARAGSFGGRLPDLTGTWARRLTTVSSTSAPLVGEIHMTTVTIQRLVHVQRGNQLDIAVDLCLIEIQSDGPMRTIIPDAFLEGIGPTERRARLEPLGDGFRFRQEPLLRILGAELESPETDPLPENAGDPRVVDQDRDGQPGMTVRIEGVVSGEVYSAQRMTRILDGVVRDRDTIEGYVAWTIEQSTLGASSFMLNVGSSPRVDPNLEHNTFVATRIDERMDCTAILAERGTLFGADSR